jgi:hypothetical protein
MRGGGRDEGCLSEGELEWQAADFFSREPSAQVKHADAAQQYAVGVRNCERVSECDPA